SPCNSVTRSSYVAQTQGESGLVRSPACRAWHPARRIDRSAPARALAASLSRLTSWPVRLTIPASGTEAPQLAARSREVMDASDTELTDGGSGRSRRNCRLVCSAEDGGLAGWSAGNKGRAHGRFRDSRHPGVQPRMAGKAHLAAAAGHPPGRDCRLVARSGRLQGASRALAGRSQE